MKRRKHTSEQVIRRLAGGDKLRGEGKVPVAGPALGEVAQMLPKRIFGLGVGRS